jgi:hypothetical protein
VSIQHFSLATGLSRPVYLTNFSASAFAFSPASASAIARLTSAGEVERSLNGGGYTNISTWLRAGIGAGYECQMVMVSGTNFVGTLNTWLALSSNRSWSLSQSGVGTTSGIGTLSIRPVGGGVIASCQVSIDAVVEP